MKNYVFLNIIGITFLASAHFTDDYKKYVPLIAFSLMFFCTGAICETISDAVEELRKMK
jgi:hypothetical protein